MKQNGSVKNKREVNRGKLVLIKKMLIMEKGHNENKTESQG